MHDIKFGSEAHGETMPAIEALSFVLPNNHEATVHFEQQRLSWGEGSIVAPELSPQQLEIVQDAIPKSLVVVSEADLVMSGCTDGRGRLQLLDGSEAPVWQKTVGTDLLTLFAMAEALGSQFYGDMNEAPAMDRLKFVMTYMTKNHDAPTAHVGCGARAHFPLIVENAARMANQHADMRTQIATYGPGIVDQSGISKIADTFAARKYDGWDADEVQHEVEETSGAKAVKVLETDESGNHGHNEAVIVRLLTPGVAFSARKFIEIMRQTGDETLQDINAFSLNDDRVRRLAKMIGDNPEQYQTALTAGLLYSEAGWATLGKGQYIATVAEKDA